MKKYKILKEYFGYDNFRPLQEEAINTILNNQDLLMILPTGGGKSLCYQLPTLLMDGVTIVISPLLALMHDQVVALRANGISAQMLSSMQTLQEAKAIEQDLIDGKIKLLYVAPERLVNNYFLNLLKSIKINFFVIDEAHCLSEWGHEFREDYRKLNIIKELFPSTIIAAFTATATKLVEGDIIKKLSLKTPKLLKGSLYRKNLTIIAKHRIKDGKAQLLEFLQEFKGESGIVYTLSRKSTETLSAFLQNEGLNAKPYHAGLATKVKNETYADFISDKIEIIVATIAFGMGIDKSNIRFVVHFSLPKTIENYYQEIGRAGRDGLESKTLLLFGAQDIINQKRFINELPDTSYRKNAHNKLEAMARYASSELCRHKSIAKYFEQNIKECINKCDNCLNENKNKVDITIQAKMLLSAIWRTNQSFGLHYIIDILRGSKEKRILNNNHNNLSVYGIGKEQSKTQWLSIADRLLELNALEIGDFKVYKITQIGILVLKGKEKIEIKQERLITKKIKPKSIEIQDINYNKDIFEHLRILRKEIAIKEQIPPYIVFSDKTLKDMSAKLPKTKEQMLDVHGVAEVKYKKYGEKFLKLLIQIKQD